MSELDEAFEEETQEPEIEETTEEESEEATEEGEEKAETEEQSEEEEPASTEPTMVPLAAKQAEKERRKKAEEEAQQLREELKKYKVEEPGKPDMYEDPEAYEQWIKDQARAELAAEQSRLIEQRIEKSREAMLDQHSDFIQAENAFLIRVQSEPELTNQMLESVDPAKFAYEKGNEFLDSLKKTSKKPVVPVSLTKVSAKGANTVEVEEDDDDLDSMFADKQY